MPPREEYEHLVRTTPLLSVDVALRDRDSGRYLLFKRRNEPLAGVWWTVGGRVEHCELLRVAACRKVREEAGLQIAESDLRLLGVYEEVFDRSSVGIHPYHSVSVYFEAVVDFASGVVLDSQHSEWGLFDTLPEHIGRRMVR